LSIAAIDANTAYFLAQRHNGASDSRIYKTTDGGETMTLQYENKHHAIFFNSIAFFDKDNGIAIADPINGSFVIETTSNGGEEWTRVPPENIPPPLSNEFAGFGDAGGTVLAVQGSSYAWFGTAYNSENGLPHRILRSTDKGQNWTAVETPLSTGGLSHGIGTIAFIDSLTGFAGSSNYPVSEIGNSLVKTTDGGKTWSVVSSFLPITISTLNIVPQTNGKVLFVTSPLGIAYSRDSGETWEHLSSTSLLSALSFAGPNAGWACGAYGEIAKSIIDLEPTETKVAELNQEFAPNEYVLSQNYPNPFNPLTTISFSLPEAQFVTLAIYDMNGRLVKKLTDNAVPAGHHSFVFDGNEMPSGLYLYRLEAGAFAESRKMMLVK
jgi:photosystem II stability/assembly factor-like uncharacterized protein